MSESKVDNNDRQVKGHTLKKYHRQCLDLMAHDPVIWWDIQFPVSHHAVVELEQRGLVERNDSGTRARLTEDGKLAAAEIYQQADSDLYDNPVSGRKLTPSEREQIDSIEIIINDVLSQVDNLTKVSNQLRIKMRSVKCCGMVYAQGKNQVVNISEHVNKLAHVITNLSDRANNEISDQCYSILETLKNIDETIE